MNAGRIFVALLILLESSSPAFAGVPGCINGLLLNPRAYVFYVLNRQVGQPAADWEVVLQASGIPATSSVAGTVATDGFFGITQWKGSAGNVRGRLSLPTAIPDALGYLTRSVDVLADNPAWPVKCWQDSRACVWAWREHLDEPAYAPRRCPGRPTLATDFDGDGRSDATVFRPSTGVWYSLFANGSFRGMQWGGASDVPASGDYDGDGKTDLAVFRPSSGEWFQVKSSSNNTQSDILRWGGAGDRPVPADYDGDGVDDVAVYRPSNGTWYSEIFDERNLQRRRVGQQRRHSGAGRLRRGRHGRHCGLPSIDGNLAPAILQHGRPCRGHVGKRGGRSDLRRFRWRRRARHCDLQTGRGGVVRAALEHWPGPLVRLRQQRGHPSPRRL